jgi:hypothetical protein
MTSHGIVVKCTTKKVLLEDLKNSKFEILLYLNKTKKHESFHDETRDLLETKMRQGVTVTIMGLGNNKYISDPCFILIDQNVGHIFQGFSNFQSIQNNCNFEIIEFKSLIKLIEDSEHFIYINKSNWIHSDLMNEIVKRILYAFKKGESFKVMIEHQSSVKIPKMIQLLQENMKTDWKNYFYHKGSSNGTGSIMFIDDKKLIIPLLNSNFIVISKEDSQFFTKMRRFYWDLDFNSMEDTMKFQYRLRYVFQTHIQEFLENNLIRGSSKNNLIFFKFKDYSRDLVKVCNQIVDKFYEDPLFLSAGTYFVDTNILIKIEIFLNSGSIDRTLENKIISEFKDYTNYIKFDYKLDDERILEELSFQSNDDNIIGNSIQCSFFL